MGHLLLFYQEMNLVREKNQLQLEQLQDSSELKRVEKNIQRKTKYYESLFTKLRSQAQTLQNQANMYFQNYLGMGANSVDPYNPMGSNQYTYQAVQNFLQNGYAYNCTDATGKTTSYTHNYDMSKFANMWSLYMQSGGRGFSPKTNNGQQVTEKLIFPGRAEKEYPAYDGFDAMDVEAFMAAIQQAQMQQGQMRQWIQTQSSNYQNNISIWLEAQEAQLTAEQDAALEPLNYKQTMLELDKTYK